MTAKPSRSFRAGPFRRALAFALLSSAVVLPQPAAAQYSLNVRDADVRAFVADAAKVTGRTFIVDGRVQGKISVVSERPLSRSEYFEVFLSTLRANGLVAIPTVGGAFRIQPAEGAATQPSRVGSRGAAASQFVTEIVRLKAIDATQAVETIRPLVSREGTVTANKAANSLVIADYADNVRRIRNLLAQIDRDTATSQIVTLENAGAREIAASLQALGAGAGDGGRGAIAVAAIDSANAIALRGDATTVAKFAAMARELDKRAESGAEIRVYWLEHADAGKLLPVVQRLLGQPETPSADATPSFAAANGGGSSTTGGAPAAATSAPALSSSSGGGSSSGAGIARRGPAVVTRYEGANAIIIAANPEVQRQIGELIRQLDTRREQVLVEAIIVEIGDDAAKKLGVQFLLGGKNIPFAATNYSNATPSILTLGGAYAGYELSQQTTVIDGNVVTTTQTNPLGSGITEAAAQALLNATGGFAGFAGKLGQNGIFGAIINAVQSDTTSNILSTPSITTLDNQEAKLLVGQEVPVTTGEALSQNFDNQFRTVQRQNVGIQLEVKPQINSSGEVKLFLRQEVSSVAGPVSSRSSDLVINKREFNTVLTVDDGDIVAIGGLLDDNERRTLEKIPLLGDIPIIGQLFRSRSKTRAKTNLMVFIRPTIIRDRKDAQDVTARRYGYIRADQLARNPDAEPTIDTLVRDYLGAVPPVSDQPLPGDAVITAPAQIELPPSEAPTEVKP